MESEARSLMKIMRDNASQDGIIQARGLTRRLITRLICLSGGGTTDMQNNQSDNDLHRSDEDKDNASKIIQRRLLNSLYFSYGLAPVVKRLGIAMSENIQILRKKDANRILGKVGLQGGILKRDGLLDLHRIFSSGVGDSKIHKKRRMNKSRRVEIELGAGFGDWIVQKAIQNQSTNFVSVELRADRVAQIFTRAAVLGVENLCVVGGDSSNLLRNHIASESVDAIYVNFPEPPTQTFGVDHTTLLSIMEGGQEPAHMLNSNVILAAMKCLKRVSTSKFVMVTDNLWEGKLICATIEKVMRQKPGLLDSVDLTKLNQSFKKIEGLDGSVSMFEGLPNESIGYPSPGSEGGSYFDRLWRHSEKNVRYIIVIAPCSFEHEN